jgi:hypothetical protein
MIVNFYLPDSDTKLLELVKSISGQKRRSVSYVVREALEYYLLHAQRAQRAQVAGRHLKSKKEA